MKLSEYKKLSPIDDLITLIERAHLPMPEREYKFNPDRQWRADLAWTEPERRILLEVDGGVYSSGRHTRGQGFTNDILKLNAATLAGWRVFRLTPQMIKGEYGITLLKEILR